MIMWRGGQGSGSRINTGVFQLLAQINQIMESNTQPKIHPMIGKTITIKDYQGKEVTGKVLGIDPQPCLGVISGRNLKGEHFIIAGPSGGYADRTYASTSNPYKVQEDAKNT